MKQTIRTLPPALQAELDVVRSLSPDHEVYPEGKARFQLYRGGFPKKGPMTEKEMLRWLDGFREGFLDHGNAPAPKRPQ